MLLSLHRIVVVVLPVENKNNGRTQANAEKASDEREAQLRHLSGHDNDFTS